MSCMSDPGSKDKHKQRRHREGSHCLLFRSAIFVTVVLKLHPLYSSIHTLGSSHWSNWRCEMVPLPGVTMCRLITAAAVSTPSVNMRVPASPVHSELDEGFQPPCPTSAAQHGLGQCISNCGTKLYKTNKKMYLSAS
ncbi:hypothetical protein GOODEAATRI_030395 [Goodea atripinnis]|uniref:Uncharacterized protein n=1 Tax=Goodea atripinnis TaxID=208336 RepID=A0ABV0N5G9_9TELE